MGFSTYVHFSQHYSLVEASRADANVGRAVLQAQFRQMPSIHPPKGQALEETFTLQ